MQPATLPGGPLSAEFVVGAARPLAVDAAAIDAAAIDAAAVDLSPVPELAFRSVEFGWPGVGQFRLASLLQATTLCGLAFGLLRRFSPEAVGEALIYGGLVVTIGAVAVPVTYRCTRNWGRAARAAASWTVTLLASAALAMLLTAVSP
jgi:hypothetical protein